MRPTKERGKLLRGRVTSWIILFPLLPLFLLISHLISLSLASSPISVLFDDISPVLFPFYIYSLSPLYYYSLSLTCHTPFSIIFSLLHTCPITSSLSFLIPFLILHSFVLSLFILEDLPLLALAMISASHGTTYLSSILDVPHPYIL